MLLALACVAGAQDPPPPGGGGGGTDYPRITNITASGSSATVEYYLDKQYTGGLDDVRLQVYYDGFEIENRVISGSPGTYTANVNLGRENGYFYVRLTLELVDDPISGTWEKGIGRAFRLKNNGTNFSLFLQAAWVGNEGVYTWPVRAKCPPGGCGGGASQGATVASCPIPDVQYSIDFPLEGGGAAPCVSCGGGGGGTGDNAYGPTFSIRLMAQYSSFNSSLSPGYFTPYDSQAFVFYNAVDNVTVVRVVDVEQADILTFRDGVEDSDLALSCQLLDANGNAASIANAVKAVMTRYDGSQLEFSLYDVLDNDATLDKDGRLAKLINPQGLATTVTYSTSNPGQMASVTGPNGQVLTFGYTTQIGGRETLSSVTLSDGNVVQFVDDDAHLTQASIGSSWSASFGITNDEEAQTANFSIQDGQGGGLTTLFTQSFFELHGSLLDQPEAIVRGVMNASGETISGTFFNPQDSSCYLVWRGTDYLSHVDIGVGECFMTNFSVGDPSQGYSAFTFTSETSYPRNIFMSGYTPNEFITGAPDQTLDAAGYTTSYAYDPQHFKTQASYGDGSSEHWVYNTRHQVTRHQDRLGRVTNYVYDTAGNLLEKQTGILWASGADVPQAEYGVWKYEYNTRGQVTKEKDPLFNPAQPDLHVTEYNYDANTWLLTSKVEAATTAGGSRPTTSYTYNAQWRLATVTDPSGHVTTYSYDGLGRVVQTLYHDGTTDQSVFGASGSGQVRLVLKRKDRNNVVTTFSYDLAGRVTQKLVGAARDTNIRDGQPDQEPITDPNQQQLTTYQYQPGTSQISEQVVDGDRTTYEFDYRMRTVKTKRYPRSGATLESLTQYFQNQVFYTQDAYGRREYMGYRASDGELIRRVQTTHPSYTLANNTAIMNLTRTTTPNAAYVIADAIKNAAGELTQVLDGRGTSTTYDYDSRGQQIRQRAAQCTALEAVTEWTYDVAGNTLEVRTPRYFDATDPAYQQAKSTTTYNGRNQVVTSTEAPGTPVAATTQTSYYADGRVDTTTDARGNAWKSVWYSCCGNSVGQRDPAGHGSLSNSDPMGHAAHTAVVQDFDTHTTVQDPLDAKTLAESTTKFDVLGRPVASTQWLTARGQVDPQSVPLAGLYAADKTEGLTTQTLYDQNLADGVGLDSATGMTVSKLGGGTYNVSLTAVLTKLASTPANGGASVTFATGSDGSATVSISPQEELTVSVQDGLGRTVCTAQIQSYSGSSPNALVSWQCTQYDSVVSLSGFGNVLETVHIDAANGQTKSRTDGAGRTLQTLDALGQATTLKYDAGGAVVERRDANNVGYNAVFDALGRETSRTDTQGAVVQTSTNRAGDVKTVTDAKNQVTTSVYDARGRLISRTNRLSGGTAWTYDANGNLLTLTDAENQTTACAYDSRNLKIQETYPDHVAGATVGTAGYGIMEISYDPARRVQRKTDQVGDTVTYQFDLAGRLTRRDYRTRANSPAGTIADSDLFTFDLASRMLTAVSGRYANTVTQTYDGVGRLKTESLTVAGQTYPVTRDYDVVGRLSRLTYPDGSLVDRTYTARSQLYQVKHNNSLLETRAYDNGGRWTSQTYGNGVVTTRTYRNDNLTTLIDVRDGSNAQLDSFAYTYDANQNKTAETRTGVMAPWGWSTGTSGYDAEDRLRAWNRTDGQLTQGWNLTLEGDWQQFTQNGTPQNRTHGPAHEVTAVGGTGLAYDVKGNLTQAVTGHRYTWDFRNQLQGVDTSGDQVADVTFGYDALGRRVKKTASGATKIYVSAMSQEIAEYVSGAVPTSLSEKYVYGDYIDEPIWKTGTGGAVYYHANALYCVSALTNGSGVVVERYRYTPYGELTILAADGVTVRSASNYANPYTYTGRRWDGDTGLYYYRARYYHPALGRFVGRDPMGLIDGASSYCYAADVPTSQADPTGRKVIIFGWEGLGGASRGLIPKFSDAVIRDIYDPLAESALPGHVKFGVDKERALNPWAIKKEAQDIVAWAKQSEYKVGCVSCYPRIVLVGYSWGGNTAVKVASEVTKIDPLVAISAIFTIDPVLRNVYESTTVNEQPKPNVCRWSSFYQTSDSVFLGGTGFKGDVLADATNHEVTKTELDAGPYVGLGGVPKNASNWGHVAIPHLHSVQSTFSQIMREFNNLGPARENWSMCGVSDVCLE